MKKSYTVDSTCNDMRIDRWLRLKVGKIPQGLIEKYLRSGKIKINKKKVKSSTKVKTNDVINSFIVDFKETIVQKKIKFEPSKDIIKSNEDQIIDNNENFIVLNKSSGISVQGGTKSKKNLVDIFAKSEIFQGTKPYSVHRLDKDTSGVFIMAKTRESAQLLTSLFRLRKVHKTYLAICHGELVKDSGEWNDDLIRYDGERKIIEKAKTVGAKVLIDGAQATPHMKVDVQKLGVDFYTFSAHKMCGPTGFGVLYGDKSLLESMPPYRGGGDMIDKVSFSGTTYNDLPHKFEAGTPNISGAIAFGYALDYLNEIGLENIYNYENELLDYATKSLKQIDGLKIYGDVKNKTSVIKISNII